MQQYASPSTGAGGDGASFYQNSGQQQTGVPNPDDLQLTAQLSRGLAPIMNAGAGGNMSESQDPRGPSQGNVNHSYDGMPHTGNMQSVHSPMGQMGGDYGTPDGSTAPRKRSKVSRACDECRRKKIRCDATGESEGEQCSNCKRVGTTCQFSRVPMKRGPSKGYIKELADRLNTLESAVHSGEVPMGFLGHQESPTQRRASEEFSPPPHTESKKRTYSSVSGEFGSYLPQTQRNPPPWSPSEPARHLQHPSYAPPPQSSHTVFKEPIYTTNGMPASQDWRAPPEQHIPNASFEVARDSNPDHTADWDESIIDRYFQHIHPTYRLLQNDRSRLRARLDSAPPSLKTGFIEALHTAVRSFPASTHQPADLQNTARKSHLQSPPSEKLARSLSNDVIHLQTLLLLAVAATNNPSVVLRPQNLLSRQTLVNAIEFAYTMKLHLQKPQPPGDDIDSDDKVLRRLWMALISMDIWYAASTGRPSLVHDYSMVMYPEDQNVLGDTPWLLARMSIVLDHASRILAPLPNLPLLASNPHPVLGTLLQGELERIRESLPSSVFPTTQAPIFHICYWHMRLIVEISLEESSPAAMADIVLNLITQINYHKVFGPLIHYSQALAALALFELLEYEEFRDKADAALKDLTDIRVARSSWDATIRDMITNRFQHPSSTSLGIPSSTAEGNQHASVASQSLQRLADLATATEEGRDVAGGEEREGDKSTISASVSNPVRKPYQYWENLRQAVGKGFLYAVESTGGVTAR